MKHLIFLVALIYSTTSFGQIQRSLFNAYDVTEINQIKVALSEEETNIQTWPGDNILVESNIAFYDGTKSIFEKLIEAGRYSLEETRGVNVLTLSENPKMKSPISGMSEVVERTVYIPECYQLNNGVYTKAKEEK